MVSRGVWEEVGGNVNGNFSFSARVSWKSLCSAGMDSAAWLVPQLNKGIKPVPYLYTMSVRKTIPYNNGVYFITFTCARWLPLFKMCDAYHLVYNWFNVLVSQSHYIIGYVTMPHHVHAVIAFKNTTMPINTIIGNGKRFIAYELINILRSTNKHLLLTEMQQMVNDTDKKRNKLHEVFEPSFDWKECRTDDFIKQKLDYMHRNPCKCTPKLAATPEEYIHSSARFYILHQQGAYPVTSYMELHDIDLTW